MYEGVRVYVKFIVFFFSSRRRHTRLQGDWSSDVCSSDLELEAGLVAPARQGRLRARPTLPQTPRRLGAPARRGRRRAPPILPRTPLEPGRSEERRVGKSVDLGGRRIIKKKKKKKEE